MKKIIAVSKTLNDAFEQIQNHCAGFAFYTYFKEVFPDNPTVKSWVDPVQETLALQAAYVANKSSAPWLINIPGIIEIQEPPLRTNFKSLNLDLMTTFPNSFVFYFSYQTGAHFVSAIKDSKDLSYKIYNSDNGIRPIQIASSDLRTYFEDLISHRFCIKNPGLSDGEVVCQIITYQIDTNDAGAASKKRKPASTMVVKNKK